MKDLNVKNKTVLVLADFILPIAAVARTIEQLARNKNKVIVVSGVLSESLENQAEMLAEALNRKYVVLHDAVAKIPEYHIPHLFFASDSRLLSQMRPGDIAVVENLNLLSKEAVIQLKGLVQIFVNDNFGADERMVRLLSKNLPVEYGSEFTGTKKNLDLFMSRVKKPFVLIFGGAVISGKEAALDKLMRKADTVLIGGAIANLFFKIQNIGIGKSVFDRGADETMVKKLLRDYRAKIKLPLDVVVASEGSDIIECLKPDRIKAHQKIFDVGPQTILEYSKIIKNCKTLVWSGALGRVEEKRFTHGTVALLRLFASRAAHSHIVAAASGETILLMLRQTGFLQSLDAAVPRSSTLLKALSAAS